MNRPELLERYRSLPLPTTKDEHWRFTDLRGFDPDGWTAAGAKEGEASLAPTAADSMLHLEVSGLARVGEAGIEIERAPDGVRFEALTQDHPLLAFAGRLGREVRGAQRGALATRLAGARFEGRRARAAAVRADRERGRGRFALLAPAGRRRAGEPLQRDRGVRVESPGSIRVLKRGRRDRRPAGSEGRVRLDPEPLPLDLALRLAPRPRRARCRARLGDGRPRLRARQGADPERSRRPRSDLARHGRLLRRRYAAPRLRHLPGAHRARHDLRLRLQGRAPRHRPRGLARDDQGRGRTRRRRTPTRRTGTCSSRRRRTRTRSRASRSLPTTCAARTAQRSARSTASSSST